jgi:hypothetical protein
MNEQPEDLESWLVPLDSIEVWRRRHGVVAVYLNDIALGVRLDISEDWWTATSLERWSRDEEADEEQINASIDGAIEKIGGGMRQLLQEIQRENLRRPVLGVCSLPSSAPARFDRGIRRLAWDDEWHRADFALRVVNSPEKADELLLTLMGDTMGALDQEAREVQSGAEDVRGLLEERLEKLGESGTDSAEREVRLVEALLSETRRALDTMRDPGVRVDPDLTAVFRVWLDSERRTR